MYHYITLWGLTIHMTGLWIIAFLAAFLFIVHREGEKHNLNTKEFFSFVPIYIIIIYLCATYVYYLIENFVVLPFNFKQILLYITPYNYAFHSIGIAIGALVGWWKFLKDKERQRQRMRINIWAYALLWAFIPLGIFLVLGDSFIGKATEWWLYISAIRSDSQVAIYDRVIPLGFAFSLLGVIGWWIMYLVGRKTYPYWGYFALGMISLAMACIFLWQQYPRRLVSSIAWVTFDIKQYFFIAVALGLLILRLHKRKTPA